MYLSEKVNLSHHHYHITSPPEQQHTSQTIKRAKRSKMTGNNKNKTVTTTTKTTTNGNQTKKKKSSKRGKGPEMNIIVQATSPKTHTSGPGKLMPGKGGTTVIHREIVATITGDISNGVISGNSVISRMSFGTKPGQLSPLTWVGRLASNFDRFKVNKASYEFVPLVPHTTGGATIIRYDPDPFQQRATDFITESANQNARSKQVYLANKVVVQKNQLNRLPSYICQPGADADTSVGEAGSCHLTTSDVLLLSSATAKSYTIGHLWLDYSITFMNPSQNNSTSPPGPTPGPAPAPTPTPSGDVIIMPGWNGWKVVIGVNKSNPSQDEKDDDKSGTPMTGSYLGTLPNVSKFTPIPNDSNPPPLKLEEIGLKLDTKYAVGYVETNLDPPLWRPAILKMFPDPPAPISFLNNLDIRGIKVESDGDQHRWWESIAFLNGSGLDDLTEEQARHLYGANDFTYNGMFMPDNEEFTQNTRFAFKEVKTTTARSHRHRKVYIQARQQGLIQGL